jgi:hypothetical protein
MYTFKRALSGVLFFVSAIASGGETMVPSFNIGLVTPARWESKANFLATNQVTVILAIDTAKKANFHVIAGSSDYLMKDKNASVRDWVTKLQIPDFYRTYFRGKSYTVSSTTEGKVRLQNGVDAESIYVTLLTEAGAKREAHFFFWESMVDGKRLFYYAYAASTADNVPLESGSEYMQTFVNGVRQPVPGLAQ